MGCIKHTTPHTDGLAVYTKAADLHFTNMGIEKEYISLDFQKQIHGAFLIVWAALSIEFFLERVSISPGH